MAVPAILPTEARGETFGGVTYHIEGELVPALQVELSAMQIYFEHHILLWKDPSVEVSLKPLKGAFKRVLSGMPVFMTQAKGPGFFIDTFTCLRQEGILWLHGYGNVFEVLLGPNEQIDIEPGGWIYKDRSVQMQTIFQKFSTGLFASAGQIFWNRFTGPGRIALQSMYVHLPTE